MPPTEVFAVTQAYIRRGSLDAMAIPMRPSPCSGVGRPFVSCCQLFPPSIDLNNPLPGPLNALPYSHDACRADHKTAYTVWRFVGSKTTCIAPVSSSL